ncbi:hypothetical protein CERSUDRAFT_77918 [Gelatoporia subvermispora B]|uniref:Uncharacterized protein n=1 Tax=Ceriporiopsis subvermispora (strain B) TaxID=914234 RepID=M2Q4V1_CERS8|nr:hypothetical protein CERSUDRAFT_77918 [Gelatoporia subvermispora B]
MPFEEHQIYDERLYTSLRPAKAPGLPTGRDGRSWHSAQTALESVENLAVLAEQDILRKKLAMSVLGKSFEKLRSLGFGTMAINDILLYAAFSRAEPPRWSLTHDLLRRIGDLGSRSKLIAWKRSLTASACTADNLVYVDDDNERDHGEGSAKGNGENYEEGADKDSESSESDSGDVSVTTWVPPEIHPIGLEYTIWKLLPWEEHDIFDDLVAHLFETYKGPWPSPENVFNELSSLIRNIALVSVGRHCANLIKSEWTPHDIRGCRHCRPGIVRSDCGSGRDKAAAHSDPCHLVKFMILQSACIRTKMRFLHREGISWNDHAISFSNDIHRILLSAGKASTIARSAVPSQKVGLIAARRNGLLRGTVKVKEVEDRMPGVCFPIFLPLCLSLCFTLQNLVCIALHMHMPGHVTFTRVLQDLPDCLKFTRPQALSRRAPADETLSVCTWTGAAA